MDLVFSVEDPRSGDIVALLERHLAFAHANSPAEHVHALDVEGLLDHRVTFVTARAEGVLVAVGALKELDPAHGELKSMHTALEQRNQGIGGALLEHLLAMARHRGYERVSLETGTGDAFVPAQAMYRKRGFETCAPFAQYTVNPHSTCMTLSLVDRAEPQETSRLTP
jgi:putative acetyltransferase